jgi:3-hydroxybutyryl-CoA dehydrogenase
MTEINRVGVIGAGQMGGGIAQVIAAAGTDVIVSDITQQAVDKGLGAIRGSLERLVNKEKISAEQRDATLGRIDTTTSLEDFGTTNLVIEAAPENEELKLNLFRDLDRICPDGAILASNTSSIAITRIAAVTERPEKVIGMHFMNPVPLMRLVEIIRALQTDDSTYQAIENLTRKIGKEPVEVKDSYGFVSNRVLVPMINEAVYAVYEGLASPEGVDAVMKLGMNHPMGPLTLADMIGLDTCLYVMEVLYEGFNDSKYRPCPLLKQMVNAGYLGRKSGRGFYTYD